MAVNSQPRSITPEGQQEYDVTRMCEDDFERLAVYIVPDVPCERGTYGRAEKTLPRSLTLKPSLVLSTPSVKVQTNFLHQSIDQMIHRKRITIIIQLCHNDGMW